MTRAVDQVLADLDAAISDAETHLSNEAMAERDLTEALLVGRAPRLLDAWVPLAGSRHAPLLDALQRQWDAPPATPTQVIDFLRANGIEPEGLELPESSHALDKHDVGAAIAFGILGALAPSFSPTGSRKDTIASYLHRNQDGWLKHGVEAILGPSSSPLIDTLPGQLHRFADHSHDLARLAFDSLTSAPAVRVAAARLVSHLIVDAFGATGVPLPGSTYVREWIGLLNPADPRMSRLHSRIASYRHTDTIAAGLTSVGLLLYSWIREIPTSSLRRPKLAIIAHATAACTVAVVATVNLNYAARRSKINAVSAALVVKNAAALVIGAQRLHSETAALETETTHLIRDLLMRAEGERWSRSP